MLEWVTIIFAHLQEKVLARVIRGLAAEERLHPDIDVKFDMTHHESRPQAPMHL
jgi:hypothetical protein